MKNKILLNNNARNHIRIFPRVKTIEIPENEADKINFAKSIFEKLEESEDAIKLYQTSNRKKGFLISVWKLDYYYIVLSIRNEFETYNNTIYIHDKEQDSINIAKFLRSNCGELMKDYKNLIIDAREDYVKQLENKKEVS